MDTHTLRSVTEKRYYRYFIYYIDIFPKSKQYLLRKGAQTVPVPGQKIRKKLQKALAEWAKMGYSLTAYEI